MPVWSPSGLAHYTLTSQRVVGVLRTPKADPYGVNLKLRKSGSKCAVKIIFSKLKMGPYGESENGKYEANVRPFRAFRAHGKEHILKTKFAFIFSANGKEHCVKI